MKPNPIAQAAKDLFKLSVSPAAETNTPVVLASQQEPEPQRKQDEGDGTMPKSNAHTSDRAVALEDIYARRNAQAVEEGNETVTAVDEAGNEVETAPPDAEITGADIPVDGEPAAAAQAAPVARAAPEETRTIIVDGRAMQVPLSKIIERGAATLQKEVAAEARLEQANRLLAEAQRVSAQARAPSKDAAPQAQAIENLNDDQLAELIQFGSKEQAAQAIKILRTPSQPQVKVEDIVRQVRQEIPTQMAFEKGKDYVIAEYGDLLRDPDLGAIFLNRENVARAQGDTRSHPELYKAIGEEMRAKFNRPKPGNGAASPTPAPVASTTPARTMAEKQAAKAAAPAAPRLASARLDGDANSPREPTRAETFAQMRAARGFAQGKNF